MRDDLAGPKNSVPRDVMGTAVEPGTLVFRCNICGEHSLIELGELRRETGWCSGCGSSARRRAIIRVLAIELFGQSIALPDFPERPDLKGLGMTDWKDYAPRLAEKFAYQNTFYHQEPRLDISDPKIPPNLIASQDFVISADIFEHVRAPISQAFDNVWTILRPGGVFILTVPYCPGRETVEHFPELNEFRMIEREGSYILRNVTKTGNVQEFDRLVFHGGPGATLEMRVFGEQALLQHLRGTGFEAITVHRTPDFVHGVWWPEPWSLPISARKPRSALTRK